MKNLLFICFVFLASFTANAFTVEPMIAEMQPSAGKNQVMFKIKNDSTKALSVQASPQLISFDRNGNEVNTFSNDLLILPVTATIPANSFQTFVVRYPEKTLATSKSYRIAFESANVQGVSNGKALEIEYEFLAFVHVKPSNPQAKVVQKRTYSKGGKWFLELTNSGNTGAFLLDMDWKIGENSTLNPISTSEVRKHFNGQLLLPKDTQSYEFIPFKGVSAKTMKVAISE